MPTQPQPPYYTSTTPARHNRTQVSFSTSTSIPFEEQARRIIELKKCKADPVYFIKNYLFIEEPRLEFGGPKWMLFDLWPKQVEMVYSLHKAYLNSEWRCMEKCRGVGGTYVAMAYMFWHWMFTADFIGLIGSRKEEEVDKAKDKKKNTLFAKLDGFRKRLPDWMQPPVEDGKDRSHMLLFNPTNKSSIMGDSSTGGFGKSNRASMIIIDEYAEWPMDIFGSALNVSSFIVVISTIKMAYDHFTELSDRARALGWLIEIDWYDNEEFKKAPDWLENKRKSMDDISFAREILRDRKAAVSGIVYKVFREVPKGSYPYNSELPLATVWDFGYSDETWCGFLQKDFDTGELYLIDEVVSARQDIEWFLNFYPGVNIVPNPYILKEHEEEQAQVHDGWKRPTFDFGDPSGTNSTQLRQGSIFQVLKQYRVRPRCDERLWKDMRQRIAAGRKAMERLHVDEKCQWFTRSAENYHYPDRNRFGESTSENEKPVHNWASHAMTAWEAFAISERMWRQDEDYLGLIQFKENRYQVVR